MAINWTFWALLSAGFAALTAVFGKLGVQGVDSNLATLIRTLVILGLLSVIVAATGAYQGLAAVGGRTYLFLILSGLATGASWLCYYRALQLGPASRVAPIDKLSVVLVAMFAIAFLGERPSPREWVGIAMIAGGAALIAWQV